MHVEREETSTGAKQRPAGVRRAKLHLRQGGLLRVVEDGAQEIVARTFLPPGPPVALLDVRQVDLERVDELAISIVPPVSSP